MKSKTLLPLAALCGAAMIASDASADYIGLGTQLHTQVTISGTLRNVWRVYAVFDDPNDYLISVGGSASSNLVIQTRNLTNTGAGANFLNPGGSNTTGLAPTTQELQDFPNVQWDTFATIGVTTNDGSDQTTINFIPGPFIGAPNGNQIVSDSVMWSVPGPLEQGRAGSAFGVAGTFNNGGQLLTGMGVLMMQLTATASTTGGVIGTVNIGGQLADGSPFSFDGQSFSTFIPAPGALALLGLAGLVCPRRRRN